MESVADAVLARWFTPGFASAQPQVVAAHRAMLTATPVDGYATCCEVIASMDLREDLSRVKAPTLVIAAADDLATPVEHAREIVERIPHARLAVVARAAHLANVEQPDAVIRLLLDHFAEQPS
jgi:3-oxoadipate enol-lactonase